MDAWSVACATCDWRNVSADEGVLRRSAEVHVQLKPGHLVGDVARREAGWVR